MSSIRLIFLVSVLILLGCSKENYSHELEGKFEGATIKVRLIESKPDSSNNYSTIYGSILIESELRKIDSVNLNCFQIKLNGNKTEHIYIDSVASFNTEMVRPNDAGIVEYSTYWSINQKVEKHQLVQFMLAFEGNHCIKYMD